jgi:hypothetical protein
MAKTGTSASKGFLSKVGGPKGAVAIGSVGVGAVIAAWLFWPSEPCVGGEDHGLFHAGFKRPGVLTSQPNMPASEGPTLDAKISVAPARVKPGTTVRVVVLVRARMPYGGKYLPGGQRQCFGKDANRQDIVQGFDWTVGGGDSPGRDPEPGSGWHTFGLDSLALYRSPPAGRKKLPGPVTPLLLQTPGVKSDDVRAYVRAECAYMSEWTETRTFTFPGSAAVRPGRYLVSPISPLRVTRTIRDGKPIAPAEAGAFTEGTLPMIEVLDD